MKVSGELHTPAALPPWKGSLAAIDWAEEPFGKHWITETSVAFAGNGTTGCYVLRRSHELDGIGGACSLHGRDEQFAKWPCMKTKVNT